MNNRRNGAGLTLRQAALVTGFAYLLNPVSYAEFSIYPKLVIAGNIEQTATNIATHGGLFFAAILCYLASFAGDIVIAWGLYVLLAPVHRHLSLLAAWFQIVYAGVAFTGVVSLVAVYHLLNSPDYLTAFGAAPLNAQVLLLLHTFRYDWAMALVLFGFHLVLVGYLIIRSRYIPWWLGILLVINGLGWVVDSLGPYLLPRADFGFTFVTFFGEIFLMLWLLIRGWRIPETVTEASA